jgi:hypothetical protein
MTPNIRHTHSTADDEAAAELTMTVRLSRFAFDGLTADGVVGVLGPEEAMVGVVRRYLGDRGSTSPAWPYPAFLRGSVEPEDWVEVEFTIEGGLWRSFEKEAIRQQVSVQKLSEHAVLYLAAEIDAGHLTQRILDHRETLG